MMQPFELLSPVSNDAFREIFQSMTEGIVVVDQEGKILIANPVAESMFGFETNEMQGKPLEALLPDRYRSHHVKFRDSFSHNPIPRRMGIGRDLAAIRKDGSEFPVEISLNYSTAGGRFVAIAFITDISIRKKAEESLRQSEEQLIIYATELEKKVESRTADLNASILKLEKEISERKKAEEEARKALEAERELNELKSKFVSIASHEFRTPLSTILSSISLVEQYKQKGDIAKIDKHTQRIRSAVEQLTAILNDFLSLGKLEEGKVDVNKETIKLKEFLLDVSEELKTLLKADQEIIIDCNAREESIRTDGRILRNVVVNLVSNAIKYSDVGKKIYITCRDSESLVRLDIRDEGIGIPEGEQKHLFERFFRASNASTIQGTGLGLNIVKRYIELLGGTISFSSEYGKGSTFTFIIPNS